MKKGNGESIFLEKVGDTPLMRILEFFIERKGLSFTRQDVISETNISKTTVYNLWEDVFVKQGYVKLTRSYKKIKLYTLNIDDVFVQHFLKIFDDAIRVELLKNDENVGKSKVILCSLKTVNSIFRAQLDSLSKPINIAGAA